MLRSLIEEAVAEQNEKLEQNLEEMIREQLEDFYIQVQQEESKREAAAASQNHFAYGRKKRSLRSRLKDVIHAAL
ncbi:MAG: hypothetical protein LIO94_02635 [Clostridiales bacterium]|nr:hypothetical protein [Clostridiales bacterium]